MKKRGQFYLIAAFAIIAILISLATVMNSARVKDESKIAYDWGEELEIESRYVLDYGTVNGLDKEELINEFTKTFSEYSKDTEFYFIFGGEKDLMVYRWFNDEREDIPYQEKDGQVKITVEETEYSFDLTGGESFYFVISSGEGNEKYVATN